MVCQRQELIVPNLSLPAPDKGWPFFPTATQRASCDYSFSLKHFSVSLTPNYPSAQLDGCCPVFRLQLPAAGAGFPATWCSGHGARENWADFSPFNWRICANENSLKVLCGADASHICRVPAFNKDFTLGTGALSRKGDGRNVKSICQMSML